MLLLDTTVLVYAVGVDHPLRRPARAVLEARRDRGLAATTTVEVLQEFCHVRARRRGRDDAASVTRDLATLLSPLVTVTSDDLERGLDLYTAHTGLGSFDAVLAAVARRSGATVLSADRGFSALGADHVALGDAARLDELL